MRYFFSALVIVHGLIHLMGFFKAFGVGGTMPIVKAISKPAGVFWLVALLLFAGVAVCLALTKDWWHLGIAAVVLSEVLIISAWSDAKFGTIINVALFILAFLNFIKWDFRDVARNEAGRLLHTCGNTVHVVRQEDLEHLPDPVKRWLERSGVVGKAIIRTVRLKQRGQLRTTQDGKWMNMTAEQYFVTDSPSFVWLANIQYGITHIAGKDAFTRGKGSMIIKAASLVPVANASGKETGQGTMLRYLAEIQWFPCAAISNYIKWETINSGSALATMSYMGMSVSGTFFFNDTGDITSFEALRYMENKGRYSLEKWIVPVDEYREFEGIRVPSKGRTIWKLRTGDFTWFNWEITGINYNMVDVF